MKTKVKEIEREFEVGDAFLHNDGQLRVVKAVYPDASTVLFHAAYQDLADFEWLNQLLDVGDVLYLGKIVKFGQHPEVDV